MGKFVFDCLNYKLFSLIQNQIMYIQIKNERNKDG
jgi:hypothetical protein